MLRGELEAIRTGLNAVLDALGRAFGCPSTNAATLGATANSAATCDTLISARADINRLLDGIGADAPARVKRFAKSERSQLNGLVSRGAQMSHCNAPAVQAQGVNTAAPRTYTVQPGDSLSRIALKTLGNGNAYPEIFAMNSGVVANPSLIFPGQVLQIPVR